MNVITNRTARPGHRREIAAALAWGLLLAAWVVRGFFGHPPGQIHGNHETHSYVYRLIEFHSLLCEGVLSPQWCGNFRAGLGGPYFGYYQPGFFYTASLAAVFLAPVAALGAALGGYTLAGFAGMYLLVRREFGAGAAFVAATALVLSVYGSTDLYVRGDFSEYAAMMLMAPTACALWACLREPRPLRWLALAVLSAAVVTTHPCVALLTFGALPAMTVLDTLITRRWRQGAVTLLGFAAGAGLAAFYWMPVALEWNLVATSKAFEGFYNYANHFVSPRRLLAAYSRDHLIPFTLGAVVPLLMLLSLGAGVWRWKRLSTDQRRLLAGMVLCLATGVFLLSYKSSLLWEVFTPLQRLQFPWRALALVTVAAAALCSVVVALLPPRAATGVAVVLTVALAAYSTVHIWPEPPTSFPPVREATEIARQGFFAPDIMGEWIPRGADGLFTAGAPTAPTVSDGGVVHAFSRHTGRLSADVSAARDATLLLPHYAFTGWTAEMNGKVLPIEQGPGGLMQFHLPAGTKGILDVRFHMTPARQTGWILAGLTAALSLAGVFVWRRRMGNAA